MRNPAPHTKCWMAVPQIEQVRVACKMSPNALVALAQRCTSMGLMEAKEDKKRVRLFDLNDFGLLGDNDQRAGRARQ